ncbi:MAG: hypothetical protein IJ088_09100 [Clostridia bacterium]|nr:hypothetical protein [Clostridia bacterium]
MIQERKEGYRGSGETFQHFAGRLLGENDGQMVRTLNESERNSFCYVFYWRAGDEAVKVLQKRSAVVNMMDDVDPAD